MKLEKMFLIFIVAGVAMLALIILPVAGLFTHQFALDPGGLVSAAGSSEVWGAIGLSCLAAFLSVLAAFIFGVPLAYMLARRDFRGKGFIESAIDVPVVIPHTVAGIALVIVFGMFEGTVTGIVIAMTFVSAPFLINSAKEGFRSVDPRLEKVARTLGASEWQAFHKVAFPLAFPHILSGAIMSWARAISEFAAVIMLVGFYPMIAPGLMWRKFWTGGLSAAIPIAVILIVICLVVFVVLRCIQARL
jgi:molybdate/tungstate transport system permease protein